MYSLLFQNKWFAAAWAALTLGGIYLTIPREDSPTPATEIAGKGVAALTAEVARKQAETERQLALDAFNSEKGEPYGVPLDTGEPAATAVSPVPQPAAGSGPGLE